MSRKSNVGIYVPCPICRTRCRVWEGRSDELADADAIVQCADLECGYTAKIRVSYDTQTPWAKRFDRRPDEQHKTEISKQASLFCPQCGDPARTRTSAPKSPFLRTLYIYCTTCGYKGKALLEHLELLTMPRGYWVTEIPLSDALVDGYKSELGVDLEARRRKRDDGT